MRVTVNGATHDIDPAPERSLLMLLREELGLVAAKYGCGEGACGACTVLVEGRPVRSCVTALPDLAGHHVATLEGLADDPATRALRLAFVREAAMQCGYCTPGMLVGATALLREHPAATVDAIVHSMDGHVCRCGTYQRIVRAIRRAASTDLAAPPVDDPPSARAEPPTSDPGPTGERPRRPWDLVAPEERGYFERLGDGLVVVLTPEGTERVNEASGGVWSSSGGAWLHVGADGRVTAFTGKVDVGQGNRTGLSMLVAEEFGVSLDAVEMVMGDTDLCPYDHGTVGSRSTPDAGSVLRMTAARARRWLVDTAAARWEIGPEDLEVADGSITTRDRSRRVSFGELLRGERHLEIADADVALRPAGTWRIAGRRATRLWLSDLVAGGARYTSDLVRPGMLHGRAVRPPTIDAQPVEVDLSRARAMPGVVAIHEGSFIGVAAPDPVLAERARDAVGVSWRERPGVSERDLVGHLRAHPAEVEGWGGGFHHETGDVDAALSAAAVTVAQTYTTAFIAHVPLEARVALAEWEQGPAGRVTIWTGTQRPFGVRTAVAEALEMAETDVRIVVVGAGGSYGGKHTAEVAIEAARLARAARRPVKVRWSRAEEFTWAYFRPAAVIDVRSAVSADGTLAAWEFRNINAGANAIQTPYEVANQRIDFQPAASPLRQGSYRGLAATANCFARESHMDELAHRVGLDPLAFRLANLRDERLATVFRTSAERAGWPASGAAERDGSGLGIAGGIEKGGRVATCAQVEVAPDGSPRVTRIVTAFECGAIVDLDDLVNQIEGATVMGLGGALFEAIHFDEGRITNGSMSDYRVPRFSDIPPIEVITIDRPDQPSAGAGETPIMAVAPAVANAIFAATGRRIRSMPLLPDVVGRDPDAVPQWARTDQPRTAKHGSPRERRGEHR